jgi:D-alanyl-D-alanine-carboxypeptidase/D-alanyl-D-alanine-endopeptidase
VRTLGQLLAIAMVTMSAPAYAQDAVGDWRGVLKVSEAVSLPVVIHLRRDDAGTWSGTMDSPSQGAAGIPLEDIVAAEGRLGFKVPLVSGEYAATWDEASSTWKGQWSQGGGPSLPLDLAVPPPPPPLPANWQLPSDAEIAALIDARIAPRAGQGLVIGVLDPQGSRVVARGPAGAAAFDGDTLFEIGSISKVFTALILADMANKGEVSLDDPAEKYLPAGATVPSRGGRKITLRDLATHTSGLPRLPDNMPYSDIEDPYADYTEALLLEFLAGHELGRDVGEKWDYSNLGVGLLGYLVGRAAGSDYETLLRERITGPLGMTDTSVALSAAQQARFAPALDMYMRPTKPWTLPGLVGAGGIRSTAADMLKFAAGALDPNSPIGPAMKLALTVREPIDGDRVGQALGWQVVHPEPGREILQHGGGTGGFRTHLALEPSYGRAVVALANSAAEPSATDLALHALVGSPAAPTPAVPPPPPAPVERAEVTLPAAELDRVVGRYEMLPGVVIAIARQEGGLTAQLTGQPAFPIYAEGPLKFFWRVVNAEVEFSTDANGKVTGGIFKQDGRQAPLKRLEP